MLAYCFSLHQRAGRVCAIWVREKHKFEYSISNYYTQKNELHDTAPIIIILTIILKL